MNPILIVYYTKYMQKHEKSLTEAELAIKLKGFAWNGVRRYLEK